MIKCPRCGGEDFLELEQHHIDYSEELKENKTIYTRPVKCLNVILSLFPQHKVITEMTILEFLSCGHKFPTNEVELTNADISDKYFRINWNYPKCNTEGLTIFINNKNEI